MSSEIAKQTPEDVDTIVQPPAASARPARLPFPPLTKAHILACSFTTWYPLFRSHTPKARLVPLSRPFLDYLRSDGIVLPSSAPGSPQLPSHEIDEDEGFFSSSAVSSSSSGASTPSAESDPSLAWPEVHSAVQAMIRELGGAVVPKLNWSAPKDATWISATNSLECRSANDVYLLLKSSDFITHDLEHAFDGCVDWEWPSRAAVAPTNHDNTSLESQSPSSLLDTAPQSLADALSASIPYTLVLRKYFLLNPSLEFRVFVRRGVMLGLTQRDLNHYDFLFPLRRHLVELIQHFWRNVICKAEAWKEECYAMDVYVPPPHERVWLVDFNPWDGRTDPGLWSWTELLSMDDPIDGVRDALERDEADGQAEQVLRLPVRSQTRTDGTHVQPTDPGHEAEDQETVSEDDEDDDDDDNTSSTSSSSTGIQPDRVTLRLVERDDPEAYMFNSTRYSAHKLPRDVVDASLAGENGGGLREFAERWKGIVERHERDGRLPEESEDDDDDED